jgi:hypothetical protein
MIKGKIMEEKMGDYKLALQIYLEIISYKGIVDPKI